MFSSSVSSKHGMLDGSCGEKMTQLHRVCPTYFISSSKAKENILQKKKIEIYLLWAMFWIWVMLLLFAHRNMSITRYSCSLPMLYNRVHGVTLWTPWKIFVSYLEIKSLRKTQRLPDKHFSLLKWQPKLTNLCVNNSYTKSKTKGLHLQTTLHEAIS